MSSCVFLHLAILTEPGWLFPPRPSVCMLIIIMSLPPATYLTHRQKNGVNLFASLSAKWREMRRLIPTSFMCQVWRSYGKCCLVTSANHPISLSTKCWLLKTHLEKQITGQSSLAVTDRNNGSLFIHSMTPNAHLLLQQSSFNSVTWASQISPAL